MNICTRATAHGSHPIARGAVTTTFGYDANGNQASDGAGTETYLYAGDQRIAEYDGTGAMTARYVPGSGEDNPLLWYDGSGTTAPRALQGDERGSIVSVADASGALLAVNSYDEYGVPALDRVTKANLNLGRYQYTGQLWIPQLGLYYYKARFYSPFLGRFLQTDPVGYKDQNNLYAYVGNDPMNRNDPNGEKWLWWAKSVIIQGGTAVQRARYERAVDRVLSTPRGKQIQSEIDGSNWLPSEPVTIKLRNGATRGEEVYKESDGAEGTVAIINPSKTLLAYTPNGVVTVSPERLVAHVLGHIGDGIDDEGPNDMDNVNKNENPIVEALGLAPRTGDYDNPPPEGTQGYDENIEDRKNKKTK